MREERGKIKEERGRIDCCAKLEMSINWQSKKKEDTPK